MKNKRCIFILLFFLVCFYSSAKERELNFILGGAIDLFYPCGEYAEIVPNVSTIEFTFGINNFIPKKHLRNIELLFNTQIGGSSKLNMYLSEYSCYMLSLGFNYLFPINKVITITTGIESGVIIHKASSLFIYSDLKSIYVDTLLGANASLRLQCNKHLYIDITPTVYVFFEKDKKEILPAGKIGVKYVF